MRRIAGDDNAASEIAHESVNKDADLSVQGCAEDIATSWMKFSQPAAVIPVSRTAHDTVTVAPHSPTGSIRGAPRPAKPNG